MSSLIWISRSYSGSLPLSRALYRMTLGTMLNYVMLLHISSLGLGTLVKFEVIC